MSNTRPDIDVYRPTVAVTYIRPDRVRMEARALAMSHDIYVILRDRLPGTEWRTTVGESIYKATVRSWGRDLHVRYGGDWWPMCPTDMLVWHAKNTDPFVLDHATYTAHYTTNPHRKSDT